MELRRYLHLIRRRLIVVLVCIVVGAGVGYVTTSRAAQYRTYAQLYVGSRSLANDPVQLYAQAGLNQIVSTFATMIQMPVIAQKAVAATGVPRDAGTVAAETRADVVTGTNLINVVVTDPNPVVAQQIANGVSNAFVAEIQAYEPSAPAAQGTVPAEPAYVFQAAPLPIAPLSNGLTRHIILGAIFGLVISVLLILLLDYLDVTVRSPEDLERRLDLPVLAVIPLRRVPTERILGDRVSVG